MNYIRIHYLFIKFNIKKLLYEGFCLPLFAAAFTIISARGGVMEGGAARGMAWRGIAAASSSRRRRIISCRGAYGMTVEMAVRPQPIRRQSIIRSASTGKRHPVPMALPRRPGASRCAVPALNGGTSSALRFRVSRPDRPVAAGCGPPRAAPGPPHPGPWRRAFCAPLGPGAALVSKLRG